MKIKKVDKATIIKNGNTNLTNLKSNVNTEIFQIPNNIKKNKNSDFIKRLWMANTADEIGIILSEYHALTKKGNIYWRVEKKMKSVVVVDIDGTVSKVGDRLKYLKQEPKDWDSFYNDCFEDEPIWEIIRMVEDLYEQGNDIVFCTGRRESCRDKTIKWLEKHFSFIMLNSCKLLMRPHDDKRHDTEVKPELIKNSGINLGSISLILEDRKSMVDTWRKLGFICLQVADGDF